MGKATTAKETEDWAKQVRPFATRAGVTIVQLLLIGSGAMCPKCGYGTRVTSKRWARCKKCGERVKRRDMDEVGDALAASRTQQDQPTDG